MTLNRRHFMSALGATTATAALPSLAGAAKHRAEICYDRFRSAVGATPSLDPWRSVNVAELAQIRMKIDGQIPKGLHGTLFRNGPAGFERAGARYQHWFDGDGMVQAFRIGGGEIVHHGRKVATAKWRSEEVAGRFLRGGAGSTIPSPQASSQPDSGNPANISVLPWGDDLLALWEAGSPYALDPGTLETRERVVWSEETDGMPFSAHPLVEQDGRVWNFGLAQWAGRNGMLALYALSPKAGLERRELFQLPFAGYMHSFTMSERWLIFYLAPHVYTRGRGATYVNSHAWEPERGGRFLLVDKNDFTKRRWVEAPAGFVFHFADAVDTAGGGVRLRTCWADRPETMNDRMFGVMCGERSGLGDDAQLVEVEIDGRGRVELERTGLMGEFPMTDPRGSSRFLALTQNDRLRVMGASGKSRTLRAPGRTLLEEHRFVPRSDRLGDGWLVGTGYDLDARASILTVFDTASVSNAPVLLATMDRRIPFGFHGWFVRT